MSSLLSLSVCLRAKRGRTSKVIVKEHTHSTPHTKPFWFYVSLSQAKGVLGKQKACGLEVWDFTGGVTDNYAHGTRLGQFKHVAFSCWCSVNDLLGVGNELEEGSLKGGWFVGAFPHSLLRTSKFSMPAAARAPEQQTIRFHERVLASSPRRQGLQKYVPKNAGFHTFAPHSNSTSSKGCRWCHRMWQP